MRIPFIDHIWRVRGELPLDEGLAPADALARIETLLRTPETHIQQNGDCLIYSKNNPAAQDKMATFTRGTLSVVSTRSGSVLRFDLFSHALLMCFLAPLLFLAFAQMAVAINDWEKHGAEASTKSEKDDQKQLPVRKLNPIDEFLGAPAPEDPNEKKEKQEDEGRHSPRKGYFMAGLFAIIYLVGRWLEPWLVRRRFRAALMGPTVA